MEYTPKKRIVQFLEYMLGGGIYFWSGLAVFALLYNVLGLPWLPSKLIGDVVGWSLNYVVQRYWAFNDKRLQGQDSLVLRKYTVLKVADLVIDYTIVALAIGVGFSPYVGFVISALFTTFWDYFWYRFWVFKTRN